MDIKLEKPKTKLEENMGEYVIWGNNNPEWFWKHNIHHIDENHKGKDERFEYERPKAFVWQRTT